MAKELEHIRKQMAVVDVDGQKRLVLGGRTIQSKADVERRIENLDDQIDNVLPAAKAAVDGEELKAAVSKRLQARLEAITARVTRLDAAELAKEAQARIDGKIARLADVRTVLAEVVEQIE